MGLVSLFKKMQGYPDKNKKNISPLPSAILFYLKNNIKILKQDKKT
jgi:hypothetical protein